MVRAVIAVFALVYACLAGTSARALNPNRSIAQLQHTAWTNRNGSPADILAIAQTPDGYLWLGTPTGLYRFDGVRFQAVVRRVSVNALIVTRSGDLWIGAHYRFRVIAANNDGVWNTTGATADFDIPPTFFQSGWFVLLCAIIAALLLWAAYAWRLRQVTAAMQARFEERVAERERIARELHDTLLQGFQGLILRLDAIMQGLPRGAAARTQMAAALERADEVLISGRDRVRELRVQGKADLADSLMATAEGASEASSAAFRLTVEGVPRALRPIVAEEFAAIGQEALLNAFHHAEASNIEAVLTYDHRALSLRIADDGHGVDAIVLEAGGRAGHFGLIGMRERAEKIGAKFQISSRSGAGREIDVTAPAHVAYASSPEESPLLALLRGLAASASLLFGPKRRP